MKISISVKSNDNVWKTMKQNLLRGGDKESRVGWWNTQHPSGVPVAQIAQWNEEGHENGANSAVPGSSTPPRPFMRNGLIPRIPKILPEFVSKAHSVAMGRTTWDKVNQELGLKVKDTLQNIIEAWSSPPNSPITISLKGFNNPLIDTGVMLDTVQSKVVRKGAAG